MSTILALVVRKLAEGGFGAGPAKVYWWLAGKKTTIAVILAAIAGGLNLASMVGICASCGAYVTDLMWFAGVLAAVGLYDAAIRIEPPIEPPAEPPLRVF